MRVGSFVGLLAIPLLSACATGHTQSENTIGGVLAGAIAGGAIGTVCCGDPVHGLPAGILIGGIAGGVSGFLLPERQLYETPVYRPPQPTPAPPLAPPVVRQP
jgi:hypothetical protein